MKSRYTFLVAAAYCASACPAVAGENILFGPAPQWIISRPSAPEVASDKDVPLSVISLDTQTRAEGDAQTTYRASQIKILTAQGLSAGNVTLNWRPETQDLTVNRLVIRRGNQTIDVLGSGQTFTILRREQNLEQATLDGTLTANLFPEGLQVGDILHLATTIVTRNPVLGGHADNFVGPMNLAVGQAYFAFSWPADRKVVLDRTDDLPQWKRRNSTGYEFAELSMTDLRPVIPPQGAPARYNLIRIAQVSDFESWGSVARLFAPIYAEASRIPAEGPLRAEVEKIRGASEDPVVRAELVLKLVQDSVRYVALLSGLGGLVPADANDTWTRRYGDCKAKTALLMGMLAELGIDAEPVLVNTALGDALQGRLPSANLFDHVLVRATIGGRTYWLDGTRTGDTSLPRIQTPNFGWGLPIAATEARLVRMIPEAPVSPTEDFTLELDARKGLYDAVPAKAEVVLRGDGAIATHQAIKQLTGELRDDALRSFWDNRLDFVEPDKPDWSYDETTGELKLTMTGNVKMEWDGGWYETDWTRVGYQADFDRQPGPSQDAPFVNPFPNFQRTRETILLPPGFGPKALIGDADIEEEIAGVLYTRHATLEDGRFFVERTERSLVPEISAADARGATKRLRELYDERLMLRIPDGYRATESDAKVALTTEGTDARNLVQQGHNLLNAGKFAEALEILSRATKVDPRNQLAWSNRGVAEAWLNKFAEAEVSLDRAAAAGPMNAAIHRGRGLVAERQRDAVRAEAEFSAALEFDPQDEFARVHRVTARFVKRDMDGALADAEMVLATNPAYIDLYSLKAFILSGRGERDKAHQTIERMLQDNPGNLAAKAVAAQLYNQLGDTEKARAISETAVAQPKTPADWMSKAQLRDLADRDGQIADLTSALELDPHFDPALAARARLEYGQGRYEEALSDIISAIAQSPKTANYYLDKANILRALGRTEEAVAVARDVSKMLPDDTFAQVAAGKIYSAFGMRDEALAAIDRALKIRPEAFIYLNRANVLGDEDTAGQLREIEKALVLDPSDTAAISMKAAILTRQGDYAAALALFDEIVETSPRDLDYWLAKRGIARWLAGDRPGAEKDFTAARGRMTSASQFNSVCYQKALAKVSLESALEDCNRSLNLQPGNAATLDSRALVYLQMGRNAEALADYNNALAIMPRLAPSLYGRAVVRARQGDVSGALKDLTLAKEVNPDVVKEFSTKGVSLPEPMSNH